MEQNRKHSNKTRSDSFFIATITMHCVFPKEYEGPALDPPHNQNYIFKNLFHTIQGKLKCHPLESKENLLFSTKISLRSWTVKKQLKDHILFIPFAQKTVVFFLSSLLWHCIQDVQSKPITEFSLVAYILAASKCIGAINFLYRQFCSGKKQENKTLAIT